ncbi:MAG TPA: 2,3-diaminopropionate biosynthesis protein SbnA [Patescibacteria group bacterium]|nr:2,3-diaminopropionate biosynthesis protein SbnA [Patescibacteria group bacterium]
MPHTYSPVDWEGLIGNTPLVRLRRLLPDGAFQVYAKLEMFNLGGSMKDRSSLNMLESGLKAGRIKTDTTVVESSSGNMGIGMAQACKRHGLRFICVVDERTNQQNIKMLRALGAIIDMVKQPSDGKSLLEARLQRVRELLEANPNSYWPNQYTNVANPAAYQGMMHEIDAALNGKIDFLFCATGTCGTVRGCADYIKRHKLPTTVVAVDAVGSVIFGGTPKPRLIPGHGAAIKPPLFRDGLADEVIHMSDHDCVVGCRYLRETESILAGGSSGAIVSALLQYAPNIPADANVVLILGDRGDRYLDTVYNDEWVQAHIESSVLHKTLEVPYAV